MPRARPRRRLRGFCLSTPPPTSPPTDYLPGIGAAGADLPTEEAESLIARGLATTTPPALPVIAED